VQSPSESPNTGRIDVGTSEEVQCRRDQVRSLCRSLDDHPCSVETAPSWGAPLITRLTCRQDHDRNCHPDGCRASQRPRAYSFGVQAHQRKLTKLWRISSTIWTLVAIFRVCRQAAVRFFPFYYTKDFFCSQKRPSMLC